MPAFSMTRREPVFLRPDTREYEELFELLSAPGHTIPVAPYVEADGLLNQPGTAPSAAAA